MELNYTAIILASVLQFVFGAIWYTPVFGKTWGRIHGFDKYPKEVQEKMMKGMGPILGMQFLATVVTTVVFALLLDGVTTDWSAYSLAGLFWIGFIVPTQVSAVLFGGTEPQWIVKKILIATGGSLGCVMIAAGVLSTM